MPTADLVCEGGGVKGIALGGAVTALSEAGYTFPRVAGSSAGAIAAALVAALQVAGEPVERFVEVLRSVDYGRLRDRSGVGRLPLVGPGLALLAYDGLYAGGYLERFLTGVLGDLGVRTFGDLRVPDDDPAADTLTPGRRYRLVVTASDLSRRQLVRIPWDLPGYGVDPDEASVARAVRASAAIPLYFRPVRQPTAQGPATWVDGSLLSGFPIGLFDRTDSLEPRWPTFGIRLATRPPTPPVTRAVRGPLAVALASLDIALTDQGNAYRNDPCTVERTVFVPTEGVSVVDFGLSDATRTALYDAGRAAASRFLAGWDFAGHVARCRRAVPGLTRHGA